MKYVQQLLEIDAIQFFSDKLDTFYDFIGERKNYPECEVAGIDPRDGVMKMKSGVTLSDTVYVGKDQFGNWAGYSAHYFEKMYKIIFEADELSRAVKNKSKSAFSSLQDFLETEDISPSEAIDILKVWASAGPGIGAFNTERLRQIQVEEFDAKHDSRYIDGELAMAAIAYALPKPIEFNTDFFKLVIDKKHLFPSEWPPHWFKPTPNDRLREIVKAGALLAAEYDNLFNKI